MLVSAIRSGDEQAMAQLYERYSAIVYSVALRVLGDTGVAEDILQEVFMRLWRSSDTFDATRGSLPVRLTVPRPDLIRVPVRTEVAPICAETVRVSIARGVLRVRLFPNPTLPALPIRAARSKKFEVPSEACLYHSVLHWKWLSSKVSLIPRLRKRPASLLEP